MTACRRLQKLVLPSIMTESCILDDVKLAGRVMQQQFWMKECDILRSRNILGPLLFSGVKTLTP